MPTRSTHPQIQPTQSNNASIPEDLANMGEAFLRLATKLNFYGAGVYIRSNPPGIFILRNVTERPDELPGLLRAYADLLEESVKTNPVENRIVQRPA